MPAVAEPLSLSLRRPQVPASDGGRLSPSPSPSVALRYRRLTAVGWLLGVLLLVITSRHSGSPSGQQAAAPAPAVVRVEAGCERVLRLSTFRHRWEEPRAAAVASCTGRLLSGHQVRRCVEPPPGQPAPRVVFVGDSRLRNIFERALHRLGLPLANRSEPIPLSHDPYFSSQNMTAAPADCQEVFKVPMSPGPGQPPQKLFFCSRAGGGRWLWLEHRWRVYLSRSYLATVSELADECDRRPARCPRLVVLDSGLWYARRFALTESAPAADWAARYRRDLAALLPSLRRLAAATQVLWKIDEPQFREETEGRKPGVIMGTLAAIQAAVYSQTAGVANLTVWSAMLPDTLFYFRNVCWLGRQQPGFQATPQFAQCANMHHVGAQLLDRHVTQLFNWLCRGSPELRPGDCCWTGT